MSMAYRSALGAVLAVTAVVSGRASSADIRFGDWRRPTPSFFRRQRRLTPSRSSGQDARLERIPGVRTPSLRGDRAGADERSASMGGGRVAPALGDEVVIVVTAKSARSPAPPESDDKLDASLANSDEKTVRARSRASVALAEDESPTSPSIVRHSSAGRSRADESFAADRTHCPTRVLFGSGSTWLR